jgi:hypothetical protein
MSSNVKFRWFLLASIVLSFLTSCASTGTLDNTSSTLQINTSEVKLEGEERAKCEWEREPETPGEQFFVCIDYSGEPRVQGYELCPLGWHDKFVAGVYSEGESRNKEQVRSGICVHNTTESRQCKAGQGCRRALQYERCLEDEQDPDNIHWADMYGEAASWVPCIPPKYR